MQLIPLEVIHSSRDSFRKARESFLIDLAGTLEPHGLNRRDELCNGLFFFFFLRTECFKDTSFAIMRKSPTFNNISREYVFCQRQELNSFWPV